MFDALGKDHSTICKCGSPDEPVLLKTQELILTIVPSP